MTPGPTRVPARVLAAGARPMVHHRSAEFSRELAQVLELIGPVFGTTGRVLPVHTTGRGAMEGAICNLCSAGDEIIVCCNGKFGELWATLAESYGVIVHRISTNWARDVDAEDVDEACRQWPRARAITLTYCDTSTGVSNDVAAVSRIARARDALVLVDGVSAIGGMPFAFDAWDVDVAVTASQKCLMSSPGLAFVAMSDRAWSASANARLPRNYWDFREIRAHVSKPVPDTPGTPPVHLVLQVAEALRLIHEEGLDPVYRRHEAMAARARESAARIGLSLQCPSLRRFASTVTALALPPGVPPKIVRDGLKARGIVTAAALGPYESSAFRIGHMGDIRLADVERTLEELAEVMASARQSVADLGQ
jgi:aspartate aminotransferase-like enzyme